MATQTNEPSASAKALAVAEDEAELQDALRDLEANFFSTTNAAPRARRHKDALDHAAAVNQAGTRFLWHPARCTSSRRC